MNMIAMQLGLQALPARPSAALVRTHRLRINAAKTPDLPPEESEHHNVLRMRQQRKDVLHILSSRGVPMRRDEIMDVTGWDEQTTGRRLTELHKIGLVRFERVARRAMWELVDQEDV